MIEFIIQSVKNNQNVFQRRQNKENIIGYRTVGVLSVGNPCANCYAYTFPCLNCMKKDRLDVVQISCEDFKNKWCEWYGETPPETYEEYVKSQRNRQLMWWERDMYGECN